jgi:hypothetical protein
MISARPFVLLALLLMACSVGNPTADRRPPTADVPVIPAATIGRPSSFVDYDSRWRELAPGLEVVAVQARVGEREELLLMARVDPARQPLAVRYDPVAPKTVREWFDASGAALVINAGYFLEDRRTAALLIVDGAVHGRTYKGFGGMFALRGAQPALWWLRRQAYVPDPAITQAVQSVPMLVDGGAVVPGIPENGARNRRSFVALDEQERVLLGVSQTAAWTLTDLATYLANEPTLGVRTALNLDGGASSGMWVRGALDGVLTNSLDAVPSVIVVGAPAQGVRP